MQLSAIEMQKNQRPERPNISMPIISDAIGVFVTPQKTATIPRAAQKAGDIPRRSPNAQPKVAPMKSTGTISPPLYPPARETAVRTILSTNAYHTAFPVRAAAITFEPRPLQSPVFETNEKTTIKSPATTVLTYGFFIH